MHVFFGIGALLCAAIIAIAAFALKRHKWAIAAKLALVTVVTGGCMAASGGCGSDLHKASLAAGSISASLNTAAQVNHTNTFESAEEKAIVANYIIQVAVANNNFVGVIRAAESGGGKVSSSDVLAAFSNLVTQVNQLNDLGVLKLKSAQAQASFALIVSSIKAELAIVQALQATSTARNVGAGGSVVAAAGLALTPAEIEELIALAIAAGSALLPKLLALRGETDAEILTQAEVDNAAAIKQAEADGGTPSASEIASTS